MDNFYNGLKSTMLDSTANIQETENGALGWESTGSKLVDLNFALSSYRNRTEGEIHKDFRDVLIETPNQAITWLFFARDREEGAGERRFFRAGLREIAFLETEKMKALIPFVPFYGRWDDLFVLFDTPLENDAIKYIESTLIADIIAFRDGKPISLLAKWAPSENASSEETKKLARHLMQKLNLSPRTYRKVLSALRKHINIVETQMSSGNWSNIDYSAVPSKANMLYKDAFLRNDEARRRAFLEALKRGDKDVKINSSVNFPHDIVHSYIETELWDLNVKNYDEALEQLWKNLKSVENMEDTIVVADGSGSMTEKVGKTNVTALSVANALAIYFAERLKGAFKDKYITFSMRPQLVDFSKAESLKEKLEIALKHNEVDNTNIEAVFDLILETAIRNHMPQEEMPKRILICSDMEFDYCASSSYSQYSKNTFSKTFFQEIAEKFSASGYKLPKLIFWNICSRTNTIPVRENELGVALISGFSQNAIKIAMSGSLDPKEALLEILNSPRYDAVRQALQE